MVQWADWHFEIPRLHDGRYIADEPDNCRYLFCEERSFIEKKRGVEGGAEKESRASLCVEALEMCLHRWEQCACKQTLPVAHLYQL